jgi:hypothetical protein
MFLFMEAAQPAEFRDSGLKSGKRRGISGQPSARGSLPIDEFGEQSGVRHAGGEQAGCRGSFHKRLPEQGRGFGLRRVPDNLPLGVTLVKSLFAGFPVQ